MCWGDFIFEYQAVILAGGKGNKIRDLTDHCPKCLLPVANKPLLYYPLNSAVSSGFSEIVVVVQDTEHRQVEDYIRQEFPNWKSLGIRLVEISSNDDLGSLEVILEHRKSILSDSCRDIFVLSCDVITDINLQNFANIHRGSDSTFTCVLTDGSSKIGKLQSVGPKRKHKRNIGDVVGIEMENNRLVLYHPLENVEEKITVPGQASADGIFQILPKTLDPHIYVMSREIVDYIADQPKLRENVTRIKSELIPYLVKQSTSKRLAEKASTRVESEGDQKEMLLRPVRYLMTTEDQFVWRADSLVNYFEANKAVAESIISNSNFSITAFSSSKVKPKRVASNIVGENTFFGEKPDDTAGKSAKKKLTIEKSVFGNNCTVGKSAIISNCVIFDNVKIGDGCKLTNCVLASSCTVGDNCDLSSVVVAAKEEVAPKTKLSNETIKETANFQ